MLNTDLNKYIASFLSPRDVKKFSCVSKSVRSSLTGMHIKGSQIHLSEYDSDSIFTYQTLVVDCDRVVSLNQVFPKIVYEVRNIQLNIQGVTEIVIQYNCNDISWLPRNINKLTIHSPVFNRSVSDFVALTYLHINSEHFDQPLYKLIALTNLSIVSADFDQPINTLVSLTNLGIVSPDFDHSINNLVSLTHLTIVSPDFNEPINHLVALTKLTIRSSSFNQPLDNLVALEALRISSPVFNHPVSELVNLTCLQIESRIFNQSVINLIHLKNLVIVSHHFLQRHINPFIDFININGRIANYGKAFYIAGVPYS